MPTVLEPGTGTADAARLEDPRANTLTEYLRVLEETRPRAFLLENVPGIAFSGKSEGLKFLEDGIQEPQWSGGNTLQRQLASVERDGIRRRANFGSEYSSSAPAMDFHSSFRCRRSQRRMWRAENKQRFRTAWTCLLILACPHRQGSGGEGQVGESVTEHSGGPELSLAHSARRSERKSSGGVRATGAFC